jgi:hypothetical protein
MLVVSKLAVGVATVALAFSVCVVAAAAFSGSSPTDWGQAVKLAVERCQIDQNQPGSEIGACVGSFVPAGLPVPTALKPGDSGQQGDRSRSGSTAPPVRGARPKSTPGGAKKQTAPGAPGAAGTAPSQIPIVTGQQPIVGSVSPVPPSVAVTTPGPGPTDLPASTPRPTPTPVSTPPPSPTAPPQGGQIPPDPSPSPTPPPPTPPPPTPPPPTPPPPTPDPSPAPTP